jgi:hypothetical protein
MRLFFGPGRRVLLDGSLARGGKLAEFVLVHAYVLISTVQLIVQGTARTPVCFAAFGGVSYHGKVRSLCCRFLAGVAA